MRGRQYPRWFGSKTHSFVSGCRTFSRIRQRRKKAPESGYFEKIGVKTHCIIASANERCAEPHDMKFNSKSCCAGLLLGCLMFAGCAARQGTDPSRPAVSVFTTRHENTLRHQAIPVSTFSNRDRVDVVVRNLMSSEQVLMVEIIRSDTGANVWKSSFPAPSGRSLGSGPPFPLPGGSYVVKVSGTGIQPVMSGFTVYGN